jgi:hypothetical protein
MKEEQMGAVIEALAQERLRTFHIIEYILNKHSHPLPRGVDYEEAFDEFQEFASHLHELIY